MEAVIDEKDARINQLEQELKEQKDINRHLGAQVDRLFHQLQEQGNIIIQL